MSLEGDVKEEGDAKLELLYLSAWMFVEDSDRLQHKEVAWRG